MDVDASKPLYPCLHGRRRWEHRGKDNVLVCPDCGDEQVIEQACFHCRRLGCKGECVPVWSIPG